MTKLSAKMDEYVNFDRHTDAQASLIEFCTCIERVPENSLMWEYALIIGACVLVITAVAIGIAVVHNSLVHKPR